MSRRRRDPAERPRRRIRKLRLLTLVGVLGVLALTAFVFGLVTAIASEIPPLDPARQQAQERNGFVYAADGHTILTILRGSESRTIVRGTPDEMSPWIRRAVVDVEDRRFYEHKGVDLRGILRAIWADLRNQSVVQGGSTITQQYVKNVFVRNQRSLGRKLREAALAWQLEQAWSKDRILTAYLNTIYFGNGAYGVQQAAETYFRHGARRLTIAEAALLAGLPADPSAYDPVTHPGAARDRRDVVLRAMLGQGDISSAQYLRALEAPLPKPERVRVPGGAVGPAPYFVNYVKAQLVAKYGAGTVFGGGLRVKTTIDLRLQRLAREAISKWLTDPKGPSAALVAIDPQDGRIRAMIGGNNFRESQFNLAVQGERQPGSSFKPFVLATALQRGVAPSTTMVSEPVTIDAGGRLWEVHNYEDNYLGTIDLRAATVNSDNSVYAQLTKLVGPADVVRTARRLGVGSPLRDYLSVGLGAQAVTPLDMARAFSAFANGGHRIDTTVFGNRPRAIDWVRYRGVDDENEATGVQVLRPDTAAMVTSILQQVVSEGTGRAAALPDRPAAGKTGTTENYGDAWFVGYTPQLVTAVWVGYPNGLVPMTTGFHGEPVAGGTYPALIWKAFMQRALANEPPAAFPPEPSLYAAPRRVVWRGGSLRLDNGYCEDTVLVSYFAGLTPGPVAHCKPNEVEVPRVVGAKIGDAKERLAAQPLTPVFAYKPAKPLQRVDIVLKQYPARGTLSSYDRVTLVVAKPTHGVVPRVLGRPLRVARERLARRGLRAVVVRFGDGPPGRVVSQAPPAGVAAARGLAVQLVVARG